MTKVILISGKAEHGKSEVSRILTTLLRKNGYRVVQFAFADYLKFVAQKYFGWNGKKDFEGREYLQVLGTNIVRKNHPNFWADLAVNFVLAFESVIDYLIIDDCRFRNEMDCFDRLAFPSLTVRVKRFYSDRRPYVNSLSEEQKKHESETELDNYVFHTFVMNSGTIDDLEENLKSRLFYFEGF